MAKSEEDALFLLIQSLTASEKRFFKIDALKNTANKNANFIQLFYYLMLSEDYNEADLIKQNICSPKQLSNLKAHLYQKILNVLRQVPSQQSIDVVLRNEINHAAILYNKGLYQQSLKILDKAKKKALQYDEHALHFEINKLEKVIEAQYITRSEKNRAEELIEDSNELIERTIRENELMNLTLWLYNYLLKIGYCNTQEEKRMIEDKVSKVLKNIEVEHLAFNEKLWWFKVKVWENLVIRSSKVEEASRDWVEHFYQNKEMIYIHPVWFIKGNHYLLQALFHNYHKKDFDFYFLKFNQVIEDATFPMNPNIQNLIFIYKNTALLNKDFLHLNYYNKHQWMYIFNEAKKYASVIDSHYLNIIKFKIGALFFMNRSFELSQEALGSVINTHTHHQKDELYFYTQLLLLMNYYDGGDDENVENVCSRLKRLVTKKKLYGMFYERLVQMFEDIFKASPLEIKNVFKNNIKQLDEMKYHKDYRRSLSFLTIKIWFQSQLGSQSIQELMKNNMLHKIK